MKWFYLILICSSVLNVLSAQIDEILGSAFKDPKVVDASRLLEESKGLKFNSPWIKSVQGRIGISGSALNDTIYGYLRNEDTYGLIIATNSLREIKKQKEYKSRILDFYETEYDMALEAALMSRYEAIINYYFNHKKIQFLEELESMIIQKQSILRQKAESGLDFRIKEVIDVEETRFKLVNELFLLKREYLSNRQLLFEFGSIKDSLILDQNNFLTVDQIQINLKDFLTTTNHQILIQYNNVKSRLAQAKLSYVESQNKNILNDFRLSYDDPLYLTRPSKFNPFNNISFRIGLNLPISGNNNFKRSEARLELLKTDLSNQRELFRQEKKLEELRTRLQTLFDLYKKCIQQKEESIITSILKLPVVPANIEALDWIEMKIRSVELSQQILAISRDITRDYLQVSNLKNSLHQRPIKNYLDKNQSNIE